MVEYPSDWKKIKLSDLVLPYGGLTGKKENDFSKGNEKYIDYLSVFNKTIVKNVSKKVNVSPNEKQNVVNNGDLLFTQSSETAEEVGMASTYLGNEKVYLNSFCFGGRKKYEFDSFFLVSLLRSKLIRDKISKEGQGSTRYNISPARLLSIEVNLPKNIDEQIKISEIIINFDTHIDNLTELIEKKKMIRDGAIEELMSGKRRLEGFDGEWKYKSIEEVTDEIITGGTPSTNISEYWSGVIPWLASGEIHQKKITKATKFISESGLINSSAKIAPRKSVLVALAGQGKTRGTTAFLEYDMALNQSLAALVCNLNTNFKFVFYALEKSYEVLREISSGDGGRGGLNKKILQKFTIYMPPSLLEQQAIADILTSMDEEIEHLEQEKEKYISLKSGAMEDLLTGKIRLI